MQVVYVFRIQESSVIQKMVGDGCISAVVVIEGIVIFMNQIKVGNIPRLTLAV